MQRHIQDIFNLIEFTSQKVTHQKLNTEIKREVILNMAQTLTWTNLKKINFSQCDDFSTIQKYICPVLSKKKQAKPTQSQPVTKIDSFGFNHDAELLCKK